MKSDVENLQASIRAQLQNKAKTSIEKVIRDVCGISVVSAGLIFDPETVKGQKIKEDADYEGVRVKLVGFLGMNEDVRPRPTSQND